MRFDSVIVTIKGEGINFMFTQPEQIQRHRNERHPTPAIDSGAELRIYRGHISTALAALPPPPPNPRHPARTNCFRAFVVRGSCSTCASTRWSGNDISARLIICCGRRSYRRYRVFAFCNARNFPRSWPTI
ncbi:hypothetical protein EVAR_86532_1 [Eumeta japonica]|uniref:Uncharacterized protein n=1 Tax=Eumeta variegata TaxID=151549 RepID=A0A4C1VMP6_EUMVA|nr:hypothetical protein EVAR_86532_1 [Eumeta japonica]